MAAQNGGDLVRASAQVLTRDAVTDEWKSIDGDEIADISIQRRTVVAGGNESIIYGQRVLDHTAIVSCVINYDLKYYEISPNVYYLVTRFQHYGLLFQNVTDAKAFYQAVMQVQNDLLDENAGPSQQNE